MKFISEDGGGPDAVDIDVLRRGERVDRLAVYVAVELFRGVVEGLYVRGEDFVEDIVWRVVRVDIRGVVQLLVL